MGKYEDRKDVGISLRLTAELCDRIDEAFKMAHMKSRSEWIVKACENELAHGTIVGTPSEHAALANMLLYDEGIMDIIYQKVAEKLRLPDIMAELDDFAAHGCTSGNLEMHLRELAAKMHYLVSDPYHEGEILSGNWAEFQINWETDWTLDEYLQQPPQVVSKYQVFHMECRDPANSDRGNGVFFWARGDDDNTARSYYGKDYFDEGECVHVLAGNIIAGNQDALNAQGKEGFLQRFVEIVRYVSRDNNIGDNGKLLDNWDKPEKNLEILQTNYFIQQKGMYAHDIPYEFSLGWVSDDRNIGKFEKDKNLERDLSIRPEIEVRWHYTPFEELDTGETPFTRRAVPETIRYGNYLDDSGKLPCHVPVDFKQDADDIRLRKDRKGYPKKGRKEVKQ